MIVLNSIGQRVKDGTLLLPEVTVADLSRFDIPAENDFLRQLLDFNLSEEVIVDLPEPCFVLPLRKKGWMPRLEIDRSQRGPWILGLVCRSASRRLSYLGDDHRRGYPDFQFLETVHPKHFFDGCWDVFGPKPNIDAILKRLIDEMYRQTRGFRTRESFEKWVVVLLRSAKTVRCNAKKTQN